MDRRGIQGAVLIRSVDSEVAEEARASIMRSLAAYRETARLTVAESRSRLAVASAPAAQGEASAAIVSMVSQVETFSVQLTSEKIRLTLADQPKVAADALAEIQRQIERAWGDRITRWKHWYGIEVANFQPFKDFLSFVEVRNALLHGGGALTRKQLADSGGRRVVGLLADIGVPVLGGKVLLEANSVEGCAKSCDATIAWLDRELHKAVPVEAEAVSEA